jgi:hypothetical protein
MLKDDFLRPLLTRGERKIWGSLTSPMKIQGFLDQAAYSCEKTYRCPLRVFRERQAHWFDGAIFDGLVETPSAALRGNPALLDKKPPFWDAGLKLPIFEGKRPFKKYLTG